ncbi:MAG: hypothetical protein ABI039_12525 [Vicinamibacterales bacterium]
MRITYLVALLLIVPLTVSSQQRQKHAQDGRNPDREAKHERRSDQRPPEQPQPAQRPATGLGPLGLPAIGLPPANSLPYWEQKRVPAWEQKQVPAWEQKQVPSWERPHMAPFDLRQIPGWEQGNVARGLLDQQKNQRPIGNDRRGSKYYNKPSMVYIVPPYYGGFYPNAFLPGTQYVESPAPPNEVVVTRPYPSEPPPPSMGALRIEVEPKELLQIFVDGVYVGTPADLGDEIELTAGARRIELRAPGYRTLVFDAEIMSDRSITYRGSLEPATPVSPPTSRPSARPPVVVPSGSRTMYLIPGCYMGNVSPKDVVLPAGCDIKKLTTISP